MRPDASVPRVLELLMPRLSDLSGVPVSLDLSVSMAVQLNFWAHGGATKKIECVNVDEGCPRCNFDSFLGRLVLFKRAQVLHIDGAYVVEPDGRNFGSLKLRIKRIQEAALDEEFAFIKSHIEGRHNTEVNMTDREKIQMASHKEWPELREPTLNRQLNLLDLNLCLTSRMNAAQTDLHSFDVAGLKIQLVPGRDCENDRELEKEFGDLAYDACGGMLCDEPGLGKTITILALIILTKGKSTNAMPARVDPPSTSHTTSGYLRSSHRDRSLSAEALSKSAATLIVAPDTLVEHWAEQIGMHVVYQGLDIYVDNAQNLKQPLPKRVELTTYDVVIVSFARAKMEWTLRRPPTAMEMQRTPGYGFDDQPDRYKDGSTRGEISSLLSVHWLRVFIDEGHKLGSGTTTQLMEMTRLLCAERRWIMTGTPSPSTFRSIDLQYLHDLWFS
ncbi:hypothetical protein PC121_g21457 [Phytophthora cactorum]|nr:hypothetical protein PC121_g21457 [Phytophthora cactorum]